MKRVLVWAGTLIFGIVGFAMQHPTPRFMDDPLFGIRYDTQEIHFESIPALLVKRCPDLRNRYVGAWVYAHARNADKEYFIISGLMKSYDQDNGHYTGIDPDITGLIVALYESGCSVEAQDSFFWISDAPVWKVPEPLQNSMAVDALQRYGRAFGGKKNFLKQLLINAQSRQDLAPVMRKQLEILEKQP